MAATIKRTPTMTQSSVHFSLIAPQHAKVLPFIHFRMIEVFLENKVIVSVKQLGIPGKAPAVVLI